MRSFKKIAAMIMAVAMLCSFTALGATVTLTDIADTTSATTSVAINYTSDASQNTILVYAGNQNVVYIDQLAKGATQPTVDLTGAPVDTTYTVMVGGTDVSEAAVDTFAYADATPRYAVTMPASVENGAVSASIDGAVVDAAALANVREGTEVVFTLTPNFGYVLSKFEVNGVNKVNGDVETFTVEVTENIEIVIEFGRADTYDAASYTYDAWFEEDADAETPDSKVFFGKAVDAGRTIKSMGMALYVKNEGAEGADAEGYVGFKTKSVEEGASINEQIDTFFAADPAKIVNNKYGIRFYAFGAGEYKVCSYVEYEDGIEYGEAIEFTVE